MKIPNPDEAMSKPQKNILAVEMFLEDNYLFRRNQLNGKIEFRRRIDESSFRPLTREAMNSIVVHAKRDDVSEGGNPRTDIDEFIHSEEIPLFNPIQEYLSMLPSWDGTDHVATLFARLPGVNTEQHAFLSIWLKSVVAHWLQMDTLHGNECVLTLIGSQGCGKTTFFARLLPPQLREYYLDHINLSNKFDKDMALTNNLLVNLDELDAIRPSQHASLKQTLSKSKVNARPIYGTSQEDRPRFASFVATTNNRHPLVDATGSRRYLCIEIPNQQLIDNSGEIDYPQLYAQVVYELRELQAPYWFDNDDVARIQQLNQNYQEQIDYMDMIAHAFRKPLGDEIFMRLSSTEMLRLLSEEYPSVSCSQKARIQLGIAMKRLGYNSHYVSGRKVYDAVANNP